MPLTPATRLGPYEIIGPIGAGGMGEVFRARDTRLKRDIAIKVLPHDVASSPERLARFEREATAVAGLNHPNIVVLHSIEEVAGTRFLTMELVEGQSLDQALPSAGLPIQRIIELGIALAEALAAAHERGVIHRDLMPANVMLTRDGRVKVLDFGLAKLVTSDSSTDLTQAATMTTPLSGEGHVVGTVPYMAPEQVRGEAVDPRTDLFALGVVLYELAAGCRPFTGATHADIGSAILRDAPMPLCALRPELPQDLDRIVSRCLEKNPRERFQTALDISNELRGLRRELERGELGAPVRTTVQKVASIAVLPFVNRSASADDEHFSDGLVDELLSVLSKIKGLRVTARTSSLQFRGSKDDVPTIGRKLGVATLLEGSVRKAGNRIRVSVQLVNVADSSHLWSETYDRTLEDIFAVQDDIAHSVVRELRTALLGEEGDSDASGAAKADVAQAVKGRGTDPEAHRLYLLARHLLDRASREYTARGIDYLKQALARDPEFALAWAELGTAYAREADVGWASAVKGYRWAREAVERALTLEPDLAEGHAQMGWIRTNYDWDWPGAEASFARALELAPGNGTALQRAGRLATVTPRCGSLGGGRGGLPQGAGARPAEGRYACPPIVDAARRRPRRRGAGGGGAGAGGIVAPLGGGDHSSRACSRAGVVRSAAGADREALRYGCLSGRRGKWGTRRGGRGVRVAGARMCTEGRRAHRDENRLAPSVAPRRPAMGRVAEEDGARAVRSHGRLIRQAGA